MNTRRGDMSAPKAATAGFAAGGHATRLVRTIAIVGAGFSGTAVAIELLRTSSSAPTRVVLIDPAQFARGVAYATRDATYLLNVPAGRMSARSADPLEFLVYVRRSLPQATEADYLPRDLYGRYLESSLHAAAAAAVPHATLELVRNEVIGIERVCGTSALGVHLEGGISLTADSVVLALGNPPPAALPGAETLRNGRYVGDPWQSAPGMRSGETVLIAGTGLTMADIVLAGQGTSRGHATVHAISRHGFLPARQTDFHAAHDARHEPGLLQAAAVSLRQLVHATRSLAGETQSLGGDWREVITTVRGLAPALWQRLTVSDRRRFLRHVHAYWDVHRHRLAPAAADALEAMRSDGRLTVQAGRIVNLAPAGTQVRVTWQPRGGSEPATLIVDRVINCTGPRYDVRQSGNRLLRSLVAQGIAVPDALGLGIETGDFGALIDASGQTASNLFYIGPMLRARYWETTAVAELRIHAERLAQHLRLCAERERPPASE